MMTDHNTITITINDLEELFPGPKLLRDEY